MALSGLVTPTDREVFAAKGYWISPKLLDDAQIQRLRTAHERIWRGEYDGEGYPMNGPWQASADPLAIRKLDNGWWINDDVRSLVTDPRLGAIAADLLGTDEIRLWHDQVLYKPGGGSDADTLSGNVGWHQDYGYWQCADTTNMVTAWVALQDTDLRNGGMMTIVGSNHWGLIPDSNTFFETDLDALRHRYADTEHPWIEEPCILQAGQASFHHALTFHGSGPNRTSAPRLSIVAHFMPKGTAFRPNVQWHPNIRLLGPRPYAGQRFANEYFPVVFSRSL